MTARFNRATHADPFRQWLCAAYHADGRAQTTFEYNGGCVRPAIRIYGRYVANPWFEPAPNQFELRLICEYCAHYINAPCLTIPAEPLAILRYEIERITTCDELAEWLRGCRAIGLAPLGGL